ELSARDVVLEVGTGTGSLTSQLALRAGRVVTVEIDPQMFALAMEELHRFPNVRQLSMDALKGKNAISPVVLDAVREAMSLVPDARFRLVANLPYNVATPILSNLLACEIPPCSMTVTIQKELADRIVAVPGTKDYGSLALWVQAQCDTQVIRVLPPTVFWPKPKVTSAIIHVVRNEVKRSQIVDLAFYHRFVRALFLHRRKFLRSQLCAATKMIAEQTGFRSLEKDEVDILLNECSLDPQIRAEQLDLATVRSLGDALRDRMTSR
ncbi:MAG: 16S rRNA (adenine(1518)-N(6)/adenine(1519)-N(6))-dimethyltransferase RsmA, partial [Planctomycetia bacterium]|nr:16S rRNA (adenine(1518)-N(6)/adenine(1519)-N(6))-dimethyltransferase RsmA [Planctomycetia bacterium]